MDEEERRKNDRAFARNMTLAVAALLLLALAPWPYGYYIFLRWAVAGYCAVADVVLWLEKEAFVPWHVGYVFLAILFNPLARIRLNREIWSVANVAGALFIVLAWAVLSRAKGGEGDGDGRP